jgi:hypothetical protein
VRGAACTILYLLATILPASAAPSPAAPWQVTLTQLDKSGKALTDALNVSCPQSGCEQVLPLYVDYQSHQFVAAITFVDRGAYVALQPMTRDVGQVIEFERGYKGPVFVSVRRNEHDKIALLRFTLTGPAAPEASKNSTPMMSNPQSLVFHRKLDPDLILQIELVRPAAAS